MDKISKISVFLPPDLPEEQVNELRSKFHSSSSLQLLRSLENHRGATVLLSAIALQILAVLIEMGIKTALSKMKGKDRSMKELRSFLTEELTKLEIFDYELKNIEGWNNWVELRSDIIRISLVDYTTKLTYELLVTSKTDLTIINIKAIKNE